MGERRGTKALELWCRRMTEGYPGVKIDNMTTSWRDGLAFCAMIHHFRPDLIEFDKLNKDDIYFNNDLAFRTAERHLGIPALLDADDMASYEVPDRLSILTYLSQFYQVFASQDSPNRLNNKRTSTTAEKAPISKAAGPPPKMAHIVGVPKREPCQKCSLPVFLAERLTIGKNVYHRTCLRCARCNSQLTPGSFYETENDGEYCCETCPDEEKKLDVASSSKDNINETFNRKSIAERLAFFEQDGSKVLQKSLSDEEKSQSLKKINSGQFQATYKPNTALNSFMSNHLSDTVDSTSKNSTNRSSSSSPNTSSGSDIDDEQPPELPKSLPPSSQAVEVSNSSLILQSEGSPESSLDNNLSVGANDTEFDNKVEVTSPNHEIPSMEKLNTEQSSPTPTYINRIQNNVTKDSSEYDEQMRTIENRTSVDDCKEPVTETASGFDNSNTSSRSSMVRARLHQFEVIANKSQNSSISSISKNSLRTSKELSIDKSPNSLETEVPKNVAEHCLNDAHSLNVSPSKNIFTNNNEETASYPTHTNENTLKESTEKNTEKTEEGNPISQEMPKVEDTTISEEIAQRSLSADKHDSNETIISAIVTLDRQIACESSSPICDEQQADILTEEIQENSRENVATDSSNAIEVSASANNNNTDEYPDELNPFKSDDDDDEKCDIKIPASVQEKRKSLNPFESCDEVVEKNSSSNGSQVSPQKKISTNPFGSESEDEDESFYTNSTLNSAGTPRRTPVPTPRNYRSSSRNPTPEPTPRTPRSTGGTPLRNTSDYYGSTSSLSFSGSGMRSGVDYLQRGGDVRGSGRSLESSSSSVGGTTKPRRKKAPAPPPPASKMPKELFSALDVDSKKSSPGSSTSTTPTPSRKKRPAPAPPSVSQSDLKSLPTSPSSLPPFIPVIEIPTDEEKSLKIEPQIEKLCDEEKVLFENGSANTTKDSKSTETSRRRLIALDASLIADANFSLDVKEAENVVYRRTIAPLILDDSAVSVTSDEYESHDRQLEKLKDNKEAKNRNRQSQVSLNPEENDPLYNKSIHGKWKRRKGPAPALPIPPKKVLQMLPLQEIRHELEIIEVQQQGLEKQGVMLEKMIRERCEGPAGSDIPVEGSPPNSKEVEDLILQLFELVNEKNELFRRQAELMYLRRQHRLEQEQADLEYEIRVLMAQPERNKTDSDKAREEALIARLVEVVQLRNEVIECLEMDRLREAEEDLSIKQQLEMHSAKRDEELNQQTPTKLSKKEKKKQKEQKKLGKSKKLDADKDADESEINAEKQIMKKKKKKFLF